MTTRHEFDTCMCIIDYKKGLLARSEVVFVRTVRRCSFPAHVAATGAAHLTVVLAHNRSFKIQTPVDLRNPTPASMLALTLNTEVKKLEKDRSR